MRISNKGLTKKLDTVVREILHKNTKNKKCFVCGREADWFHPKENPYGLQVGHYVTRSVFILRWDLKNCEPVCSSCNRIHEENILPHTLALVRKYGQKRIEYLNKKYQIWKQSGGKTMTRSQKQDLLEELTKQLDK